VSVCIHVHLDTSLLNEMATYFFENVQKKVSIRYDTIVEFNMDSNLSIQLNLAHIYV